MRYLAVVRHGDYKPSGDITSSAVEKAIALGKELEVYKDGNGLVLSSPVLRAVQTARVLAEELKLPFQQNDLLASQYGYKRFDIAPLLATINEMAGSVGLLIVVTHEEIATLLPAVYGETMLNKKIPQQRVAKGNAVVIDCEERTYTTINQA